MRPIDWDAAHRAQSEALVGYSTAEQYHDLFNRVGAFTVAVEEAESVLEVGPGLGAFLASLQPWQRIAVEVSAVNRAKLEAAGVLVYAPGVRRARADVALALSVLQHCEDAQVEEILADVLAALPEGGSFFCNGISGPLLPEAGVIDRPLVALCDLARSFKLASAWVGAVDGLPLTHYLARFTRR